MTWWRTREGKLVSVEAMTDKHLLNSLRLVTENLLDLSSNIEACESMSTLLHGDMAEYYADQDLQRMIDMESSYSRTADNLRNEVKRRGLRELPPRKRERSDEFEYFVRLRTAKGK